MTSEIIVMNRTAVAVAADSAATYTGEKIFTTDKIFKLSKYHPVGVMLYGNSHFVNIPWETTIKLYRNSLMKKKFDTLEDYANDFFNFIMENNNYYAEENVDSILKDISFDIMVELRESIVRSIEQLIKAKQEINDDEAIELVKGILNQYDEYFNEDIIPSPFSLEDIHYIKDKSQIFFDQAFKSIFENLNTDEIKEQVSNLVPRIYVMNALYKRLNSGLVFFGFGDKEIFPSFFNYKVYTILNKSLKYDLNSQGTTISGTNASISAFAQEDVIVTFIEGMAPDINLLYENSLPLLLKETGKHVYSSIKGEDDGDELEELLEGITSQVLDDHKKNMHNFKYQKHIEPLLSIVSLLPKTELAEMAESLVHLTSLKRRLSTDAESVGGPIDVAVISKGDGFIWIKRKHYFDSRLNHHFQKMYFDNEV